eukprot:scaffold184_cov316-Pinguiococcus_pyrenoidosus.AAC.24
MFPGEQVWRLVRGFAGLVSALSARSPKRFPGETVCRRDLEVLALLPPAGVSLLALIECTRACASDGDDVWRRAVLEELLSFFRPDCTSERSMLRKAVASADFGSAELCEASLLASSSASMLPGEHVWRRPLVCCRISVRSTVSEARDCRSSSAFAGE